MDQRRLVVQIKSTEMIRKSQIKELMFDEELQMKGGVGKPKKQVRFEKEAVQVITIDTPSPDERRLRWYTAEDLSLVRKATRFTLKELAKHDGDPSELDSNIHCLRGLDRQMCYKDKTRQRRRDIHRNFVLSVLEQQYCHQQLGISDPGGLGMFARASSKWSRERAFAQAAEDARDANRACMDETDFFSSILTDALALVDREGEDLQCTERSLMSTPHNI